MEKRVSIIIPCYNHGKFLEETVNSVLASTYKNIEIVIVNDGSTDNSEEIASGLSEQHNVVKYIYQTNSGLSSARNRGIADATGDYILPLDADDLISPNYIKGAVDILQKQANTKVVYCQAEFFGAKQGAWKLPEFSLDKLVLDNHIFCSAIYRKEDWSRVGGYDKNLKWGWEDWDFWLSILKDGGNAVKLPLTGFYYRIASNSMRKSFNKASKRKTIDIFNEKHRDVFEKKLCGPLHYQRTHSKKINLLMKFLGLKQKA